MGVHEAFQPVEIGRRILAVGIMGLVMGLKRLKIIGQVGGAPVEAQHAAIGDQLSFSEGFGGDCVSASAGSVSFFLSCTP